MLVAVNAKFPVPFAGNPIPGFELIQLNTVPTTVVEKFTVAGKPSHKIMSSGSATSGFGFTTMVNCCETPLQPKPLFVNDGVTVMVALIGVLVAMLLVATKIGI